MGRRIDRKKRFLIGCFFITLAYVFPLASVILLQHVWGAIVVVVSFIVCVYFLYRFTIRKGRPKYPALPPTGQPDIYTKLRIPRPIHEDVEQHPWLFRKGNRKRIERNKKVKKKQ